MTENEIELVLAPVAALVDTVAGTGDAQLVRYLAWRLSEVSGAAQAVARGG
ncbi:hypothetical protein GCM10023147_51270 [Tsukamurella soli]|uniref:HNH endonuclease n=2 Tax=Tsukamurella soli TaxID=644556 RepID=A0ABP8KHS6_9ACTN